MGRTDEAAQLQAEIVAKERERLKKASGANAKDEADWKEGTLVSQLEKLGKLLTP